MLDLLDILQGRANQTIEATYFTKLPEFLDILNLTAQDLMEHEEGAPIDIEYVNPTEWHYKQIIGNLVDKDGATATVKTRDANGYRGGYIVFDGKMYQILSCLEDTSGASREAMRMFPVPLGTEYILRLLEIDNPWEVK